MRFPTRALARLVSPARGLFALSLALFATLVAACTCAAPASASHYVVNLNGGGDFTTIQAAIDAYQTTGWRESVLVMPGRYAEHLVLDIQSTILGVDGAGTTSIEAATMGTGFHGGIEDITFMQPVIGSASESSGNLLLRRCVFRAGFLGMAPSMVDCDFYGRSSLRAEPPNWITLRALRFHGAPCLLDYYNGALVLSDCTFEGPADTLLYIPGITQGDPVTIQGCSFKNARRGLVLGESYEGVYEVTRCTFSDLSEVGIWRDNSGPGSEEGSVDAGIGACRFERCGTAVYWRDLSGWGLQHSIAAGGSLWLAGDTLLSCTRDGAVIGPIAAASVYNCIVDGSAGDGMFFREDRPAGEYGARYDWQAWVGGSIFRNNGGAGVSFEDSTGQSVPDQPIPNNHVETSWFSRNGDSGLKMSCGQWSIEGCSAIYNTGDGFTCIAPIPGQPARLTSNTSALNTRDGFRLAGITEVRDYLMLAQHNLALLNAGAGLRVPAHGIGSLAFNDANQNYAGQYIGTVSPTDSNLTVDPRFCDLSAGFDGLGLQQGSPCGPSGVYGLIGAWPEKCGNTVAVPPAPAAEAFSFSIRPSVARRSVEFVTPAGAGEGRVEVFDISGRVMWRALSGAAGGVVRWQGETLDGRAHTGLYWVRFTRGAVSSTRRLVWME